MVPGGALEALNSDEDKIRLVLNRRKGFIKLALRFGVNLVPTFSFGENFIYDQVKAEQGKEIVFCFTNLSFYCSQNFPAVKETLIPVEKKR